MTDTKCSYMKLATENYEEICNSKINYCPVGVVRPIISPSRNGFAH